jgi:hypothetical protein
MRPRLGALALALLPLACVARDGQVTSPSLTARSALGAAPPSEVATWTRVAGDYSPDPRVGQAAAYDSNRKVVMVFGGAAALSGDVQTPRQDVWEWNPARGAWRNRTGGGLMPDARSEAAVVYDSARDRFIMFGGRAGSGSDFQDTWEWNPSDGTWTEKTVAGPKPDPRARHAMVYDEKRKVVVLFGGGRTVQATDAATASDVAAIAVAFASTWEYEPVSAAWTDRTPAGAASSPAARYDAGMAWDSKRNLAVLFGGMQKKDDGVDGSPKQDTWEWDGSTGTWTERTLAGNKPSPRFGHGMACDPGRGNMVVFGGYDINTGNALDDLWDWEPQTGTWTERPASASMPSGRVWASLVALGDSTPPRMELVAGSHTADSMSGTSGTSSLFNEVWDLDPSAGTWVKRPTLCAGPAPRSGHAMATDLDTGKIYLFGGAGSASLLNDLWVWSGADWSQCDAAGTSPPVRAEAAMAYDPVRKSLIVFGGTDGSHGSRTGVAPALADTWEWNIAKAAWTQVKAAGMPPGRMDAVMVTDPKRGRIVMVGGGDWGRIPAWADSPDSQSALFDDVWEWNGSTSTWTDVTPPVGLPGPRMLSPAVAVWDTGRGKLVAWDNYDTNQIFEWDPSSHAWTPASFLSPSGPVPSTGAAFDAGRLRMVALGSDSSSTFELDTAAGQWSSRPEPLALQHRTATALAYDNKRAAVVLFGGIGDAAGLRDDTWEYKVTGLGNGTACSGDFANRCASGNCVDGVCCESASCTAACQACNVPDKLGTCAAVAPGIEVAGSCSAETACDGTGKCKAAGGSTCASGAECASGFCSDGVCCDTACKGTCMSCKIPGRIGTCSPYQAGTDPETECGAGTGICKSSCDGLGKCAFPTTACEPCGRCDGLGTCTENYYSPHCNGTGGAGAGGKTGAGGGSGAGGAGGKGGAGAGGSSGAGGASGGSAGGVSSAGVDGSAGFANSGGNHGTGGSDLADAASDGAADTGDAPALGGVDSGGPLAPGTGGSTYDGGGSLLDGGGAVPDGGVGADVRTTVAIQNRGCACHLGKGPAPASGWMLLLGGLGLLLAVRDRCRKKHRGHRGHGAGQDESPDPSSCSSASELLTSACVPVSGSVSGSDQGVAVCVGGSRERERTRSAIRIPAHAHALAHADRDPRVAHEHARALAHSTLDPPTASFWLWPSGCDGSSVVKGSDTLRIRCSRRNSQ